MRPGCGSTLCLQAGIEPGPRVRLWPIADVETCLSTGRLLLRQSHFQFPRERIDVIDGNRGDTKAFTDLHPNSRDEDFVS